MTAPHTAKQAYGHILDLIEIVRTLRVAAESELHPLTLPEGCAADLVTAQQALFAAHRKIEAAIAKREGDAYCHRCGLLAVPYHIEAERSGIRTCRCHGPRAVQP